MGWYVPVTMAPKEAAARWRAAQATGGAASEQAEADLRFAVDCHARARVRRIRTIRIEERVDGVITEARVLRWVRAITSAECAAGAENGFVNRCAVNAARDFLRKRRVEGVGVTGDLDDEIDWAGRVAADPESLLDEQEEFASNQRRRKNIWDLLESAPKNYRDVVRQHYIHGKSIEDLTDAEFARRVGLGKADPLDLEARQRARNSVDASLSRARRWLASRLLDAERNGGN